MKDIDRRKQRKFFRGSIIMGISLLCLFARSLLAKEPIDAAFYTGIGAWAAIIGYAYIMRAFGIPPEN